MEKYLNTVKERVKQHIDLQGISKRRFYSMTGMANGTLDQKTGLSEENMVKYLSTFPDINPDWLITGEGHMLRSDQIKSTISQLEENPTTELGQQAMKLIIDLKKENISDQERNKLLDELLIKVAALGDKISALMADMLEMYKEH